MSLFVIELVWLPLSTESSDMNYVGDLDPEFHKKVIDNWSLPMSARHSLDVWKLKVKRMKQMLKGWNINVEGRYKKLKKILWLKLKF
jgi:hypothetical protein